MNHTRNWLQKNTLVFFVGSVLLLESPLFLGFRVENPLSILGALGTVAALCAMAYTNTLSQLSRLLSREVLIGIGLLFAGAWLYLILVQYYSVRFNNFDTGIYANQIANFWKEGHYYSSILQRHALGEHFTPNLVLLSPALALADSFLVLPIVKLIAFCACPLILYAISKEVLGRSSLAVVLPVLWCFHKYLGKVLAFEFQPSNLALPFILLVFLYALRGSTGLLVITLMFLLGFKEHLALIWISVGTFLLIERRQKAPGLVFAGLGVILGICTYFIVMPWFADGLPNSHSIRFQPTALPLAKLELLIRGLLSVGLLPLLAPRSLLWLVPAYGIAFVSNDPQMVSYSYHYQDIALAVLFVAAVFGLRNLISFYEQANPAKQKSASVVVLILTTIVLLYNTQFPMLEIRKHYPTSESYELVAQLNELKDSVPPEHELWTLDSLGPYFYANTRLRSIVDSKEVFAGRSPKFVLVDDSVERWPLDLSEFEELNENLNRMVREGTLVLSTKYHALRVYRTTSKHD